MSSHSSMTRRAGFTAIELVVVIGIMLMLMAIAVPGTLNSLRRGKIHSAVNDITMCWRQARLMAMTTAVPTTVTPWYFGIVIKQTVGQQAFVGLIYDNVATGDPKLFMSGEDPADTSTYNAGGTASALYKFNRNVVLASTPVGGDNKTAPTAGDQTIILYSQYGTGLPLSPAKVAAGRGLVSPPCSLGVASDAALSSTVCPQVQLRTQDYTDAPQRRGFASSVAIYHAGFAIAQEL